MIKYSEPLGRTKQEETAAQRIHIYFLEHIARFLYLLELKKYIPWKNGYFVCPVHNLKISLSFIYHSQD